ncbi:RDD family protein [Glycomyces sp. NPDC047369]
MAAQKIKAFADGTRYVEAGGWARCFAWLVDFVMYLVLIGVGIVAVSPLSMISEDLAAGAVFALPLLVPLVYGLFYTNGRSIGAIVTGTRLVRLKDGGRIGAKGPWAMLVRTLLLPLLLIGIVVGGGYVDGTLKRGSIDVARTRRLYADGHHVGPLPAPR